MEKIDIYNQISREIVKNYNTYLHPTDVKVLPSMEVPEHYTISHIIETNLANSLHKLAVALKELDQSLIINDPKNYHITLFWKSIDSNLNNLVGPLQQIIEKYTFKFTVEEILFGPLGVSAKFYPKDESFIKTREEIYNLTNTPITIDERYVTTWVSLAAYTTPPKETVKKFVQDHSKESFGNYEVDNFKLYISNNKGLVNPKEIATFNCKGENKIS